MNIDLNATAHLPTRFGDFQIQVFTDPKGLEHLVLSKGQPAENMLVRLHSECATGDIFTSIRCDCRQQLELAMQKINEAGQGMVIYLRGHEGRGIGITNKIRAYAFQDQGMDTVEANVKLGFAPDQRNYDAAIAILKHFGINSVQLLTNNPKKIEALEQAGIHITKHIEMWVATNPENEDYVETKKSRMGHIRSST